MTPEAYEGEQIKLAIRELFESSRNGKLFSEENPLRVTINKVNGVATKVLNLYKHPNQHGAVVLYYTDE